MNIFYFVPKPRAKINVNGSSVVDDIHMVGDYIPEFFDPTQDIFDVELVWMSDYKFNKLPESTGF